MALGNITDVKLGDAQINKIYLGDNLVWEKPQDSSIVTDGLKLFLDAGNPLSYPGSGTTVNDLSGNNNNGTLLGGVGFNSGNGGSFYFDGVDDCIIIPHSPSLHTDQVFSIIIFYKIIDNSNYRCLLQKGVNFQASPIDIYQNINTTNIMSYYGGTVVQHIEQNGVALNSWGCYAITTDGTRSKVYTNNIMQKDVAVNFIPDSGYPIRIGLREDTVTKMYGYIPIVMFYNKALSSAELTQNFNFFKDRFGL